MPEENITLKAIENLTSQTAQQSRDQLEAIRELSNRFTDFGQSVLNSLSKQRVSPVNGKNGVWPILFGVGALVFGLMTPMYIMVQGVADDIQGHNGLTGHPQVASQLAAMEINLQEIETQFRGINERITIEGKNQDSQIVSIVKNLDLDNTREEREIAGNAAQWERIRFLERKIFSETKTKKEGS